ncbi:hypothetical protein [Bacillus paranthracis]|nr:hypothetical protein [Bacillus paranthracis]MCU5471844.1 hypothetical protein [Bacillus paranthracis]
MALAEFQQQLQLNKVMQVKEARLTRRGNVDVIERQYYIILSKG